MHPEDTSAPAKRQGPRSAIVLVGGGGHAVVVAEIAHALGQPVAGVLDDNHQCPAAARLRLPLLGGLRSVDAMRKAASSGARYVVCVGSIAVRRELIALLDPAHAAPALVHPSAVVAPSADLGVGVAVCPRAVVHSFASVAAHAIINTGAIVEHDVRVGENTHVAPGSVLAGSSSVGADTLIGLHACVLPRVRVGDRCVVGAGAAVLADVASGACVVGVPARAKR